MFESKHLGDRSESVYEDTTLQNNKVFNFFFHDFETKL